MDNNNLQVPTTNVVNQASTAGRRGNRFINRFAGRSFLAPQASLPEPVLAEYSKIYLSDKTYYLKNPMTLKNARESIVRGDFNNITLVPPKFFNWESQFEKLLVKYFNVPESEAPAYRKLYISSSAQVWFAAVAVVTTVGTLVSIYAFIYPERAAVITESTRKRLQQMLDFKLNSLNPNQHIKVEIVGTAWDERILVYRPGESTIYEEIDMPENLRAEFNQFDHEHRSMAIEEIRNLGVRHALESIQAEQAELQKKNSPSTLNRILNYLWGKPQNAGVSFFSVFFFILFTIPKISKLSLFV